MSTTAENPRLTPSQWRAEVLKNLRGAGLLLDKDAESTTPLKKKKAPKGSAVVVFHATERDVTSKVMRDLKAGGLECFACTYARESLVFASRDANRIWAISSYLIDSMEHHEVS